MRILATLFALACGATCCLGYPRNFGKSDAQILAMSSDAWMAFYGKMAGESNAGMIEGLTCYGNALGRRNVSAIKRKPAADQTKLNELRAKLTAYAGDIAALAYYLNGGGSMFSVFGANWVMESEAAMWRVLGHGPTSPAMVVSMAKSEFDKLPGRMAAAAKAGMELYDPTQSKKAYDAAKLGFDSIIRIAATMPRAASDQILKFLKDCTQLASKDL